MTQAITVPRLHADTAWRDAARGLLIAGVPPEQVTWGDDTTPKGLFDDDRPVPPSGQITVPRSFISLANTVVWHSDPERFARLYALLWRLQKEPWLMTDRGDAAVAKLRTMEKNVRRCQHKMKAFVRFREIGKPTDNRRSFAAWFEPTHHTVEPTATFFQKRFGDMDWRIITPDVSVFCEAGDLRFELDHPTPDLPDDAAEDLWITYFENIFNPARLKVQAMQSEMPKKYWKNMPEAASIPKLIAEAPARARAMAEAAPTLAPAFAANAQAQQAQNISVWDGPADALPAAIKGCTRCPLHVSATQAVPGEGPTDAALMIVGEQPGDQEDLKGRPFVGPAGQVFDQAAQHVGLDRRSAYITNAVKHFKFKPKGRRRIHQRPNVSEIDHCKWWLDAELAQIKPKLVIAMGATAALALTGRSDGIGQRRGRIERGIDGTLVLITYHPSFVLRTPDQGAQDAAMAHLQADLAMAVAYTRDAVAARSNVGEVSQ
ncbi:UdgX family uracil-DNA binding protein [Yoonia sp. 208BN28-4]|uniref:UdgX family uracil-DNA binding protein n=1 Tax=Yoonia sp. 208BN28-4 TaxID=3126505 RepID=UPI003095807D